MTGRTHQRTANGRPITEELVEERTSNAEHGYDVDATLQRRGGRPTLGAGPAAVESVRLEPELREALHARAERDRESTSSVIRKALHAYLRRA
jgi:hypothetical protein